MKPDKVRRLDRASWLDAGWEMLGSGCMDHVKVDVLAKRLGATRGSFYWHFSDRADLIEALAQRWIERVGVKEVIEPVLKAQGDPREKLWAVFERALKRVTAGQSVALRLEALRDPKLQTILEREDRKRREQFTRLFTELGHRPPQARVLSRLYHAVLVGEYMKNGWLPLKERLRLGHELHTFLTRDVVTERDARPVQ